MEKIDFYTLVIKNANLFKLSENPTLFKVFLNGMNGDKEQWFMVFLVPILTEIRTDFSSQKAEKFVANN